MKAKELRDLTPDELRAKVADLAQAPLAAVETKSRPVRAKEGR